MRARTRQEANVMSEINIMYLAWIIDDFNIHCSTKCRERKQFFFRITVDTNKALTISPKLNAPKFLAITLSPKSLESTFIPLLWFYETADGTKKISPEHHDHFSSIMISSQKQQISTLSKRIKSTLMCL